MLRPSCSLHIIMVGHCAIFDWQDMHTRSWQKPLSKWHHRCWASVYSLSSYPLLLGIAWLLGWIFGFTGMLQSCRDAWEIMLCCLCSFVMNRGHWPFENLGPSSWWLCRRLLWRILSIVYEFSNLLQRLQATGLQDILLRCCFFVICIHFCWMVMGDAWTLLLSAIRRAH